jgi:hypothetical protein
MKTTTRSKWTIILVFSILFCWKGRAETAVSNETDSSKVQKENTAVEEQLYQITKTDGAEYVGKILSDDGREILVYTESLGKIYVSKDKILKIKKIENKKLIVEGEYVDAGPFNTRYAFTTNALPLTKGSNYGILSLTGPEVHFVVKDNYSLGIMTTWMASPFIFVGKHSFKGKTENVNFSIGALVGTSGWIGNFQGFGALPFGNVTLGDYAKNLTLSAGYLYFNSGLTQSYGTPVVASGPIFSIAGILPIGTKSSFIFDSMFGELSNWDHSSAYGLILMPGVRFSKTVKSSFQVSITTISIKPDVASQFSTVPFPMLTWFYRL